MELLKVKIDNHGGAPFCEHNYPCPVYPDQPAVMVLGTGIFAPSWKAQKKGFQLVQADNWFKRLVLKYLFGAESFAIPKWEK